MPDEQTSNLNSAEPCAHHSCAREADLWMYHPVEERCRSLCERHVLELHPSLEVNAWLESGYARPAELGPPDGVPSPPDDERTAAFRKLVDEALEDV